MVFYWVEHHFFMFEIISEKTNRFEIKGNTLYLLIKSEHAKVYSKELFKDRRHY